MNKPTFSLTLSIFSVVLSGCISHIGVTKVRPGEDVKGLRYCLPQPVIVGYPNPDGTITYEEKMLPDLEKEYAISAWSFLASHKAKITRTQEMFLSRAELKRDTTAVAKQLLESGANVGSEMATRIGDEKKEEREAAAAAAKDKKTKVAAAKDNVTAKEQAVKAAKLQLKFAKADRDALPPNAEPATRAAAEKAVKDAERAVEKAEQELQFAKDAEFAAQSLDNPAADDPADSKPKRGVAAGPIIYRIIEDPKTGGVSLEPMTFKVASLATRQDRTQRGFQTVSPAKKPEGGEKKKSDTDVGPVRMTSGQPQTQVLMPTGVEVIVAECSVVHESTGQDASDQFDLTSVAAGRTLVVTRKAATPAGEYRVKIVGKTASGSKQRFTRNMVVEAQ